MPCVLKLNSQARTATQHPPLSDPSMSIRRRVMYCMSQEESFSKQYKYICFESLYKRINRHFIYSGTFCSRRYCALNPNIACSVQKSNGSFFPLEDILNRLRLNGRKQTSVDSEQSSTTVQSLDKAFPH